MKSIHSKASKLKVVISENMAKISERNDESVAIDRMKRVKREYETFSVK